MLETKRGVMAYKIMTTSKSFCPICEGPADLLIDDATPDEFAYPNPLEILDEVFDGVTAFYLCWTCRYIGQAGVGPVERIG